MGPLGAYEYSTVRESVRRGGAFNEWETELADDTDLRDVYEGFLGGSGGAGFLDFGGD